VKKKCLIIINPISGMGSGRRNGPKLQRLLMDQGYEVELFTTTAAGDARDAAARITPGEVSVVLSVGGDGTLNEIINGLGDKDIPVALFPTGTGNVMAKEFGIPRRPGRVCEMIVRGNTRRLDVACIGDRRFLLFAGAGFDAAVTQSIHETRSGRLTMLHYTAPILKTFARYAFPDISVRVDGERVGTATTVLVTNVHSYGGPFAFVPDADPTDRLLDVCLMPGRRRIDLLRHLWACVRGRLLKCKDVVHRRGRVIELDGDGVPVQMDGDYFGPLPVRIELLPTQLPLIVP